MHFCQLITDRLTQAATEVIFSWPQRQDDQTLHPSPLIPPAALANPLPPLPSLFPPHLTQLSQLNGYPIFMHRR